MLSLWSLLSLGASAAPHLSPGAGALTGVAVRAERPGVWAVVDAEGRVWRTVDGGARWSEEPVPPLAAGPGAPRAGEVPARAVELGDPAGPLAIPLDPDDSDVAALSAEAAEVAEATAERALDALNAELEAGSWLGRPAAPRVVPRVVFLASGALAVTRSDGVWIGGAGEPWTRALREPATGLCELGGRWVVGTPVGPRSAPAGGAWSPADPAPGEVVSLVCAEDLALAATSSGLWASADGLWWARRSGPAQVAAAAPGGDVWAADGRLWVGSPLEPVAHAPGVAALVVAGGGLLAVGPEGAWASSDGGATWSAMRDVPAWPIRAAAVDGDGVLLATDHGLWVHRARPDAPAAELGGELDPGLIVAAVLRSDPLPPARSGRYTGAIPALDLIGTFHRAHRSSSASDAQEAWWNVGAALTWTPRRRAAADLAALERVDVVVAGDGEILVDDGEGRHLIAARVARDASARRSRAVRVVLELLAARRALAREVEALGPAPLLHQARAALRLAEIDARIDGLTGGAARALRGEVVR